MYIAVGTSNRLFSQKRVSKNPAYMKCILCESHICDSKVIQLET